MRLALLTIARGKARALLPVAVAATVAHVDLLHVGHLGPRWGSAFAGHVAVGATPGTKAERVLRFLDWKTPFASLILAGLGCAALVPRARATRPLWAAVVSLGAFLVALRPLLDHHFVLVATGLALPAGAALGLTLPGLPPSSGAIAGSMLALVVGAAAFQQKHRLAARYPVTLRSGEATIFARHIPSPPCPAEPS